MTEEQGLFNKIGLSLKDAELSQMFGKPCFKINGKAFTCFFQDEMVFKLIGDVHAEALGLDGSQLFDPSGKKRYEGMGASALQAQGEEEDLRW